MVQNANFDKTARPMRKFLVGENVSIKLVTDEWVKCIVVGYKSESSNVPIFIKIILLVRFMLEIGFI